MASMPEMVVVADDDGVEVRAASLARELGVPFAPASERRDAALVLAVRADGLELRDRESKPGRGLRADFSWLAEAGTRRGRGRSGLNLGSDQPLARALGPDYGLVFDATAGLGQDSALMAAMGWRVVGAERSPVLVHLLADGLQRAQANSVVAAVLGDRLAFVGGDAREILSRMETNPDVVFIDPMFPPKRKQSALAKKSIRLIRELVGDDLDAADLLATARRHARRRVVVKRPDHAPPLEPDVTATYGGKLVRYDMYRC